MHTHFLAAILTTAALAATTHVSAQGPLFGVKGGLNYTTLAVDAADEEKARIGFNGGLFARTAPENAIGLQAELLYSTKGAHATYSALWGLIDQEVDFNLNYVELPLLASIRVADILEFHGGIHAGYLLSAKVNTSGDLGSGQEELDRDHFNAIDLGLAVGAALNVGPNLQVGARYVHGLTKVANSDASDVVLGDATNRCLQVYLGVGVGAD